MCLTYLDDLVVASENWQKAQSDFEIVRQLLGELGLPEAKEKSQPPAKVIRWLGIDIDVHNMTLSLPQDKLAQVHTAVGKALRCRSMSKRHLQSILGKLMHVAKCVKPARLFIARLLEALRSMRKNFIRVTDDMKCDLIWFQEFSSQWNSVSIIPHDRPGDRYLVVDASGSGIGGTDGARAYGGQITPIDDPARCINEMEGANMVVAAHTFLTEADRGAHISVYCDNLVCVHMFRSGRGRNKILLEAARALWMVQAILDVSITYHHISGANNDIADSLSRMHLAPKYNDHAVSYLSCSNVEFVLPRLDIFNNFVPPMCSRRGVPILSTEGDRTTTTCKGPRDLQ